MTLRDKRGMRRKMAEGSFGSGDALGKTVESLLQNEKQSAFRIICRKPVSRS